MKRTFLNIRIYRFGAEVSLSYTYKDFHCDGYFMYLFWLFAVNAFVDWKTYFLNWNHFKGDSAVWSSSCWPEDWFIFVLALLKLICHSGPLKGLSQGFIRPTLIADVGYFWGGILDVFCLWMSTCESAGGCHCRKNECDFENDQSSVACDMSFEK